MSFGRVKLLNPLTNPAMIIVIDSFNFVAKISQYLIVYSNYY